MMEHFVVDRLRESLDERVTTPDRPRLRRGAGDVQRDGPAAAGGHRPPRDHDEVVAAVAAARPRASRSRSAAAGTASPGTRWPTAPSSSTCADARSDGRPGARIVASSGGALWEDVDAAAWKHHLAVVGGTFGDTGVGGLTLGGGIGWLMGVAGFTCDNLVRAEVVTAAGEVVIAGPDGDPELLWALRGGGGNFGVVTRSSTRRSTRATSSPATSATRCHRWPRSCAGSPSCRRPLPTASCSPASLPGQPVDGRPTIR